MNMMEMDQTYVAGTYRRFPVEIVSGKGSKCYDVNGKVYVDMGTGIGVTAFGTGDQAWLDAVTLQLGKLQHTSNLYYTEPCAKLAQLLCQKTGMKKVFFANSGAEANECAIKVARKYSAQKKGAEYFTILTLEQCKLAVSMGAKFIVAPGFDAEVIGWCVENGVAVTPGCVTPTEITAAIKMGLKVVKFFPANVYGGLEAMKTLSGPFPGIKFLPTGGINVGNIKEYYNAPFIHAVGGSWVCPKADISAGNLEKITALCAEARKAALG